MKTIPHTGTQKVTTIDEYIEYIEKNVDLTNHDSILASTDKLSELYNNRTLLADFLNSELKNLNTFQRKNTYTPPCLILGTGNGFFVRANIWATVKRVQKGNIHVYELPHDHNFDFLTLNYWGPGYSTVLGTYDFNSCQGHIGEQVTIHNLQTIKLRESEMFLYKKNYHIHSQLPPESMSVTINLMIQRRGSDYTNQYVFDLESNRIAEVRGPNDFRDALFRLGGIFGDENTQGLIDELQKRDRVL